jgi:ABC-type nitrate/sulfonate/bicarbonate transport system permease component
MAENQPMAERSAPVPTPEPRRAATAAREAPGAVPTAVLRLGFLLLVLALWWAAARSAPSGLFASPAAVAAALVGLVAEGRLAPALAESLSVYLSGTGAAIVFGIALGALMGTIRPVGRMLDVYVHALAATPRVAFIPLIIVMLGLGFQAKILIVFLGAVMPVILNAYAGVRAADPDLVEMARATGASRRRILLHVVLPGALPFLVTGVRIGATIGLINTVVAELYTAVSGLGGLLALYGSRFQMADYLAVVVVLALIGVSMTEGLRLVETRLLRWRGGPA